MKNANNRKPKVLIVTSVASMIDQFMLPDVRVLLDMGCHVELAANFQKGNTCTQEKIAELCSRLDGMGVVWHQIDFIRDARHLFEARTAYRQLDGVIQQAAGYDFIHCHSPIGGVIGRLLAGKYGIPVIYTAHGFHFYKGASFWNWLFYFPIEYILSRNTDILITINREDYRRANKLLRAKKITYIAGVGISFEKFRSAGLADIRDRKRQELGLSDGDVALLSVGELNKNKNHRVIIWALAQLKQRNPAKASRLHYFIAGKGILQEELQTFADNNGVQLHLLGFRWDMDELLQAMDCFLLPSLREGMNVSLLEAAAAGLPCLSSDIRGSRDLLPEANLIPDDDIENWCDAIERATGGEGYPCPVDPQVLAYYDTKNVSKKMRRIYTAILDAVFVK